MSNTKESGEQEQPAGFDPMASERLLRENCPAFDAAMTRADDKSEEFFGLQ